MSTEPRPERSESRADLLSDRKVLEFERPIVELESKIRELKRLSSATSGGDMAGEIARLEEKAAQAAEGALRRADAVGAAAAGEAPGPAVHAGLHRRAADGLRRAARRPAFGDDPAIVGGAGALRGRAGRGDGPAEGPQHQGEPVPQLRDGAARGLPQGAAADADGEQFGLPVLCFIDTAGAYPGIDAEERGQAEAIATCLELMAGLKVPTISVVIGEGGSGGALAIGVTDRILMLEHSVYSVISPRGCASILWKDADAERTAAEQLRMTAPTW
jgi:acetyl-CoA carboxylase carboxyl transferase subunit alpha